MQIKSIVAGAAIALAATIGLASAADQFTTVAGFEAQALTKQEMRELRGGQSLLFTNDGGFVTLDDSFLGLTATVFRIEDESSISAGDRLNTPLGQSSPPVSISLVNGGGEG